MEQALRLIGDRVWGAPGTAGSLGLESGLEVLRPWNSGWASGGAPLAVFLSPRGQAGPQGSHCHGQREEEEGQRRRGEQLRLITALIELQEAGWPGTVCAKHPSNKHICLERKPGHALDLQHSHHKSRVPEAQARSCWQARVCGQARWHPQLLLPHGPGLF